MVRLRSLVPLTVLALLCACTPGPDTAEAEAEAAEGDATHAADVFTPVTAATLLQEASAVQGTDGRHHVVYELLLTNTKRAPATLTRLDVLDGGSGEQVASYADDDLLGRLRTVFPSPAESAEIAPGSSLLVFIELAFESADLVPAQVRHRLQLLGADNPGASEGTPLDYVVAPLPVRADAAVVLGAPLRGEGWVAINGCCNPDIVHRGSVQSVNGALFGGQRFAIDWVQLGDDGRLVSGDGTAVSDYHGYGQEILAVADATVVSALDGLDDQVPGSLPDPATITIQTVDGNHVVLDLGDGRYAFYAHIQKGSVAVEVGDRVQRGDVLGLLGNSGNSSAPHLHLHVMDGPSVLGSEGLPFVHEEFALAGAVDANVWAGDDSITEVLAPERPTPEPRTSQFPLNLDIVDFPEG